MADTVSNGGIGKSPSIDKLNKAVFKNTASAVTSKMKSTVLGSERKKYTESFGRSYPKAAVNFKQCTEKLKMVKEERKEAGKAEQWREGARELKSGNILKRN